MSTTLSLRIDEETKERLEALAKRSRRSKSFLAAEAIASYVEAESWQLDEIAAGLDDLEQGPWQAGFGHGVARMSGRCPAGDHRLVRAGPASPG